MQYNKKEDGTFEPLEQKNVDTGMGLERMTFLLQGKNNVFETELFMPIISKTAELSKNPNDESLRIIADHLRASSLLISDNVEPSNLGQGYILRRLIRRAIRHMRKIEFNIDQINELCETLIESLKDMYPELEKNREEIIAKIVKEKNRFMNTLVNGEKEFVKITNRLRNENNDLIDGQNLFRLHDTFGFPPEVTAELAKENGFRVDMDGYKKCFEEHQAKSRQGAEGVFKGGLADNSEVTTAYHTATHLVNEALKRVLGDHVYQKGSNITAERMRFDFANPEKVSRELLDEVENMVNNEIDKKLVVTCEEMTVEEAKAQGAKGVFENKYGERVKVYSIGEFSKEICGGPHVKNTSDMKHIKIKKEEAVSSGVRRIKAVFVEE
jgi:alanyl-tRNA synthetase